MKNINFKFIKTIREGTLGKIELALHKLTKKQVAIEKKSKIKKIWKNRKRNKIYENARPS